MKILTLLTAIFLIFSPASEAISISLGEAAPAFALSSLDGKTVSLSDYKGETLILIYWKTGHERSTLALKDVYDELKKFEQKGVRVVSVIAEPETKQAAVDLLKEKGIDFPVLLDADRQLFSNYGIRVYPTTVIVDKQGILVQDLPSHAPTFKNSLDGYIRKVLGEIDEKGLKEVLSPHREEQDKASLEATRLYNLSLKFAHLGMLDQALDTAAKAVEAKTDMAQTRILLGFLYLETKDPDNALLSFNKALELDAHSHDAQTGLGGALILKGEIDRAIEILNGAANANPYPQATYYELGKAYELKGDKDKAIEMLKKAMEKIIKKQLLPSAISQCQ